MACYFFFVEMEVEELLDGGGEDFGGDISDGNEMTLTGAQEGGSTGSAFAEDSGVVKENEEDFYSAGIEENERNFFSFLEDTSSFFKRILSRGKVAINAGSDQTGIDIKKESKQSESLASVLSVFLEKGLGVGKITYILLLLLLLFIVWRIILKRLKDKRDL